MFASFRKTSFKFWSSSLPPYVHMVGGKGGCTFATVKCFLLFVIWQFFLCGFNFSCSWRHCIQISQIRVWSARNDATSHNWVLPIIKCPPVLVLRTRKADRKSSTTCSSICLLLPSGMHFLCDFFFRDKGTGNIIYYLLFDPHIYFSVSGGLFWSLDWDLLH